MKRGAGRDNGWTTEIFEPRISEPKDPGEPVMRANFELAPGERPKVQNAQPGYTVYLKRKVTGSDGNAISDGDFVSDYRCQPEAWEVGPGHAGNTRNTTRLSRDGFVWEVAERRGGTHLTPDQ